MLSLNTPTATISVIATGTPSLTVASCWVDDGPAVDQYTVGGGNFAISSSTTQIVVPPPGTGVSRNAKIIWITNTGGGSASFQVQHFDGTTAAVLRTSFVLQAGYSWIFDGDTRGAYVLDNSGALVVGASITGLGPGNVTTIGGTSTVPVVNVSVDNSSIDVNGSAQLEVKAGGVTLAKMANLTGPAIIGEVSGTAAPIAMTPTQATSILNLATASLQGLMSPAQFTQLASLPSGPVVTSIGAGNATTVGGTASVPIVNVSVDNSSIDVNGSAQLEVKAGGVTLAKMANLTGPAIIGEVSGTAAPIAMTPTQATSILNLATASLQGLMSPAQFTQLASLPSGPVVTSIGAGNATTVGGTASVPIVNVSVDNSSIDVNGSAQLEVKAGGVTLAKMANLTGPAIIGEVSGTAAPIAMTPTQATSILNLATASLQGLMSPAQFTQLASLPSGPVVTSIGAGNATTVGGTASVPIVNVSVDNSSIDVNGSAQLEVKAGGVTLAKMANLTGPAIIGEVSGTAAPIAMTPTQATSILNLATASLQGLMSPAQFTQLASLPSGPVVTSIGAGNATTVGGTASVPIVNVSVDNSSIDVNGSAQLEVKAGGVTLAKMANLTGPAIIGEVSGTAAPIAMTPTQATSILNLATASLQGLMSPANFKRMSQVYDAVADFGFVGDLITTNGTTSMAASTTTLTDTTNPFLPTDVGKRITVPRAGAGTSPNIAQLTTTIAAYVSAGQVTLSAASTNAVTNTSVSYGTDNTAAITLMQNTVNNAAFPGALIIFGQSPTNSYGFPIQVSFTQECQIQGIGGGYDADSGQYTRIGGTRLAWWGTSSDGGTAFSSFWTFAPTGAQALKRSGMSHCWIDCRNNDQNQALWGIKTASDDGYVCQDFCIIDALATSWCMGIATSPTEAADNTRWTIIGFNARQQDNPPAAVTTPFLMTSAVVLTTTPQNLTVAANALPAGPNYFWTATTSGAPELVNYTSGGGTTTLVNCTIAADHVVHTPTTVNGGNVVQAVPGNASCFEFDGGTVANTCCATLLQSELNQGNTWGPAAVETRNSDSVDFISLYINGGNNTNDGAINRIRKPGFRANGSIVSAALASRNLTFRGGSMGAGGLSCMGLLNTGARMLAQSGPTYYDLYQMGNGEPVPTVEGNAFLQWTANGALREGKCATVNVVPQAVAAATATLLNGSVVPMPVSMCFQAGTVIKWRFLLTKTAAGVAARTFFIHLGTGALVGDAIIATFTNAAVGTAVAGTAWLEVVLCITSVPAPPGAGATAVAVSVLTPNGNTGFSTTGPIVTSGTMNTFSTGVAQQFLSVSVTTGAAEVITNVFGYAFCESPANP